jgi:GAF domain-containing protein
MIGRIRERLLTIAHPYTNPLDYQRARGLLLINWVMLAVWGLWLFGSILPSLIGGEPPAYELVVVLAAIPLSAYLNYRLIQSGRATIAAWLVVALLGFSVVPLLLNGISRTAVILFTLPILSAAMVLNRRGTLVVAALALMTIIISAFTQSQITAVERYIPANTVGQDLILVIATLGISLAFLIVFGGSPDRIIREALLDVDEAQATAGYGSQLGTSPNESIIVTQAIDILRNRLGYTYAQVYLVDPSGNLLRSTGTGAGTAIRLAGGNAIHLAVQTEQPVIVTTQDNTERRDHLLPSMVSGVAVPLIHGSQVIGVLDVQSTNQQRISTNSVRLLTLLADQMASALAQNRTLVALRTDLQTQQSAAERLQEQLLSYQQRGHRAVENAWMQYLQMRGKAALGFDLTDDHIIMAATDLPETMRAALKSGEVRIETADDGQMINVPITFRDQTLGAMSFTVAKDQEISERQLEMARIVSDRLALALENTRLFEQSQAQVQRERKASELGNLLLGSTDVAALLELAAANFNEALGAVQTRIYVEREAWAESMGRVEGEEAL